jgi:hypothetical protein
MPQAHGALFHPDSGRRMQRISENPMWADKNNGAVDSYYHRKGKAAGPTRGKRAFLPMSDATVVLRW